MITRSTIRTLVLGLVVMTTGCARQVTLLAEDLDPGQSYEDVEIGTRTGTYRFDRVLVLPDSLVGEYTVEVQKQSAEHGIYYEDVLRRRAMGRDEVVNLTTKKQDAERTLFFGLGTVAVGLVLADIFDQSLGFGGGSGAAVKQDPADR